MRNQDTNAESQQGQIKRIPKLKNFALNPCKSDKKVLSLSKQKTIKSKLYNSQKWRKLRERKLLDMPFCERCGLEALVPTEDIHHITPISTGTTLLEMQTLCYDYANLMSVCRACHRAIHQELQIPRFL